MPARLARVSTLKSHSSILPASHSQHFRTFLHFFSLSHPFSGDKTRYAERRQPAAEGGKEDKQEVTGRPDAPN